MEKSSDAFRTISEVADDLDLPQHVLRFWETRFPHIRPLKRAGGRRYYRPADVVLLRTIRQLLYDEGYTIKGVQRLLKEQGARGLRTGAPVPLDLATDESEASDAEDLDVGNEPSDLSIPTPGSYSAGPAEPLPRLQASDRKALGELLATLDECTRILESLRDRRA